MNERRTRRGVYLVLPEQQDDSEESEEEAEQSVPNDAAIAEQSPDTALKTPSKVVNSIIDLTSSSPTSVTAPPRGLVARMRPSLATMKREAAERANVDIPKSIITTRGQKAREASMSSTPSRQSIVSQPVDPSSVSASQFATPSSSASAPTLRSRSRNISEADNEKSTSRGPVKTSVPTSSLPQSVPKRRGRPPKNHDAVVVKVEEKDESDKLHDRTLRVRRSAPVLTTGKASLGTKDKVLPAPEKSIPSGPCCMTCSNPLPPHETPAPQRKGKSKEIKEECARYILFFSCFQHCDNY